MTDTTTQLNTPAVTGEVVFVSRLLMQAILGIAGFVATLATTGIIYLITASVSHGQILAVIQEKINGHANDLVSFKQELINCQAEITALQQENNKIKQKQAEQDLEILRLQGRASSRAILP